MPPIPVTWVTSWVVLPEQIVLVTGVMVTLGTGFTVMVIEAQPPLKRPPFRFLA